MTENQNTRIVHLIPAERRTRDLKVAAYVRVSTRQENQEESYEAQAAYYQRLIRETDGWSFAGIYGDRQSGTHAENRREFQRMVQDALAGRIDLILCKSISRWARNTIDGLKMARLLTDNRINILFAQEGIDTRQPGHLFLMNLSMAIAQAESESISENLKWVYRKRAAQGIFIAHRGKYFGYSTDDGTFRINQDAEHVRTIYSSFLDGVSMGRIAAQLNEKGLRTTKGGPWQGCSVRRILTSEVYVGDLCINKSPSDNIITGEPDPERVKVYLKDHHDAIVDREIWEAVQARFQDRKEALQAIPRKPVTGEMDDQILELIRAGVSGREIAARLGITLDQQKGSVKRLKRQGRLEDRSYPAAEDRMEAILNLIQNNPAIREKEIRERLGLQRQQVDYALKKLKERGAITREPPGRWQIL